MRDLPVKKIIHIDMDAFYASVEQRDFPQLAGKPVAVGSSSPRGVVTTASYEARKFGIRSAMPSVTARRLCPELIFVPPRFDVYQKVSRQIREIFFEYTDLVEPLSLDEAFLDVTQNKKNKPSAVEIAREIKLKIKEKTGLTASAGVSFNKFLAKIASDMKKPDGLYLIPPGKAVKFVERLPIEKFFGVGKVTAGKMHDMGIRNGFDLKKWSEKDLVIKFGKVGKYYYQIARANDDREVNPQRIRKSLGAENTFAEDLKELNEVKKELEKILDILIRRMNRTHTLGKTLTIKIKYSDFQQITRSHTISEWFSGKQDIKQIYLNMLQGIEIGKGIRLLGLTLSNLNHETENRKKDDSEGQLAIDF
jgi:DNA polymerase-4